MKMMIHPKIQVKRLNVESHARSHRFVRYVLLLIAVCFLPLSSVAQTPSNKKPVRSATPRSASDKQRRVTPKRGSPQRSRASKGKELDPSARPVDAKNNPTMTAAERAKQRREELAERRRKHAESKGSKAERRPYTRDGRVGVRKPANKGGSSTKDAAINIPPTFSTVAPEEGKYQFSIIDGTYENLIEMVARQTGLGVIGVKPPDGKVSFVTEEELSFDELLKRIRMLLFNYKPLEPYWMLRRETHLEVIRVNDYLRELEPEKMYRSETEFREAKLADEELVLVLYTPTSGSLSDLTIVRDFMPDYVRVTPLENSNTVAIFALASDIRKYLNLVPILVSPQGQDPRTLEVIHVVHIPPSEAYEKLQALMELDGAVAARPRARMPRGANKSGLEGVQEPALSVVPSNEQGVLIVRGMRNKIEEIKLLLPYVDVDTSKEFRPVVIDVKYADPDALVSTLQDILAPADAPKVLKRPSRGKKTSGGRSATVDKIRLITHPVAKAIIVMASDEDVARVRRLIESFDIEMEVGPIRLALTHAKADDIAGTISKLIGGQLGKKPKKARTPGQRQSEIVASPKGDAIYFTGTPDDLAQVKLLLVELDVVGEAVKLHIVQLKNQLPSFVAGILMEYESGQSNARAGSKRPNRPKRAVVKGGVKGKFTSEDDTGRLFVLCQDKEWAPLKRVIDELELLPQSSEFVVLPVEHISVEAAIDKVSGLLDAGGRPLKKGPAGKRGIRYEATDGGMVVIGAKDAEVDLIKRLLAQFDQPENIIQRVFVITHREAADMMETIESLVSKEGGVKRKPKRGKPRPGTPTTGGDDGKLKIVQLDDKLIVRTSPEQMEEIAALIAEFDVARDAREIRVYDDFPPGADLVAIADSLQLLVLSKENTSAIKPARRKKAASSPEGVQFLPQPSSGKLIIVAEAVRFAEIEELLAIIRPTEQIAEVVIEYVEVTHADAEDIVSLIEPLLAIKVQHLIMTGAIEEVSGRVESKLRIGKSKKPARSAGAKNDLYELISDARNHRIVVAAVEPIVIEARMLIQSFDMPSTGDAIQTAFIKIEYGDPTELIELLEPLLSLKVQQMAREGLLSDVVVDLAGVGAAKRPGVRIKGRVAKVKDERFQMVADERNRRIVIAAPESIIEEARLLVTQFDLPLDHGDEIEVVTLPVTHVDPKDIVEQITPLLDMKVQQLLMAGSLSENEGAVIAPKGKRPSGKVTIPRRQTSNKDSRYHIQADERNGQIVLAAPRVIIDEAVVLVEMFDKPGDDSSAFETVTLQNADASDMVDSIQALMGGGSRKRSPSAKIRSKAGLASLSGEFQIVEAPGGAAVVLQGPVKLVAQAKEWISHLDSIAGGARGLKIFQIQHIDMKMLVDLIVNTVSVPNKRPGARRPAVKPRTTAGSARGMLAAMEDEDEDDAFVTTITRTTDELYLRADLIDQTLIVSASPSKLTEVERIITELDTQESTDIINAAPVPKFSYQLDHVDAYDASYELEAVLSVLWEPSDELPHVDYASFGDMLIVRYPHRDRFDEIKELIRKYVDKPSKLARSRPKAFAVPAGISPRDVALWMKINHPELDIVVEDISPREDQTHGVQELGPRTNAVNRCVLPLSFSSALQGLLTPIIGQTEQPEPVSESSSNHKGQGTAKTTPPVQKPKPTNERDALSDLVRQKGSQLLEPSPHEGRDDVVLTKERMPEKSKEIASAEKVIIKYDESTGGMIVVGNRSVLEAVPDWLDELEEEMKDLPRPPDIRIYRVKYIDVYSATAIINEMFNATRQQRQVVNRAQQQQKARAQQQQKARAQQQQAGNRRQPQQQKAQAVAMPQLPPTSVRVMPNPRDRSLILRADTNQYPAILKLLATVDQPRPINSEMRIYALDKLNAGEVEVLLKDWLGMTGAAGNPATPRANNVGARRGAAASRSSGVSGDSGQFPQPILQRTIAGDMLGIDPKDIKLSSSPRNNTIMALGPKAALDFIGEMIEDLESNEIAERTWVQYELVHASVSSLISFLQGRYAVSDAKSADSRRKGDSESTSLGSAGGLNSPTVIGYPPLKILSVQGTVKQHEEIATLIAEFDRPTQTDFEVINLAHADASLVADTLSTIFNGVDLTPQKKRGKKEANTSNVLRSRFIGKEGGRIVFFSAAKHLHEKIHATVKRLEEEAQERATLRIIQLDYARASEVSQAITQAYASSSRDKGSAPAFTVTGDNGTKQLLVMTDDDMFVEIESLAKSLDKPREFAAEFRVFRLQHANARRIYDTLSKLMGDYLKSLPAGEGIDAFGVEVDDQANAIIVLGGPLIFGFVEHALQRIDTPENAQEPPGFLMIALKNADAKEVASSIARLWSEDVGATGEDPPVVEANASLNVLIVRGTQKQVDQIKKDFVDPLEENIAPQLLTETLALQFIRAEEAAELIVSIYDKRKEAMREISQGKLVSPHEYTVVVTPDSSTNTLVVQASETNLANIKKRVAAMDQKDVAARYAVTTKVYGLTFADPNAVVTIIRERSRLKEQRGGKNKVSLQDLVLAVQEPATNSVAVTANASNHEWVESLIFQLDDEEKALGRIDQLKTIKLTYADPYIVTEAISQLFKGGKGPQSQVTAVAEPVARVVIVSASKANLVRIERLVAQLDTEGSSQQAVHVLHLSNADAELVVKTIDDIFIKSQPSRQGSQAPPISVSALSGSKAVLVKSSEEDFADIKAVVLQLDTEEVGTGEVVRVLTLLYADATEVQQAMQEYLKKSGGKGTDELVGDTRISVLTQSNGLVVSGGKQRVDQIEQLVNQLDEESEKGVVPQIIKLQYADVGFILPQLQEMFVDQKGGGKRDRVQPVIVSNDLMNSLIIRAAPADIAAIEAIVSKLDTEEAASVTPFKIIKVASGINVEDLAELLETSVNEGIKAAAPKGNGRGEVSTVSIQADKRTSTLVVAGNQSYFDDIEEMVKAYERLGPTGETIKIIQLGSTPASEVIALIDQLKGGPSVGKSSRGRRGNTKKRSSGSRNSSSRSSRPKSRSNRGR